MNIQLKKRSPSELLRDGYIKPELSDSSKAKQVDAYLKQERDTYEKLQNEPKILILGPSDAGKSTFLKQLKIIHGSGFTDEERAQVKQNSITQVLNAVERVLENMPESKRADYNSIIQYIELVSGPYDCLPLNIINKLAILWEDPLVKQKFQDMRDVIPESTSYFLTHIKRIGFSDSILTNEDVLMQRTVTQTISETTFISNGKKFHFYDVSGLKHHRKHWLPYFQEALLIIFLVDISAYDQMMAENPEMNRMVDALHLFDEIVNHPLLKKAAINLFFNKKDIFRNKVTTVPIVNYFPDFDGEAQSAKAGGKYFQEKFIALRKEKGEFLTVHFTCCTDSTLISKVTTNLIVSLTKRDMDQRGFEFV